MSLHTKLKITKKLSKWLKQNTVNKNLGSK